MKAIGIILSTLFVLVICLMLLTVQLSLQNAPILIQVFYCIILTYVGAHMWNDCFDFYKWFKSNIK